MVAFTGSTALVPFALELAVEREAGWAYDAIWARASKLLPCDSLFIALRGPGPNQITYQFAVVDGTRQGQHTRELGFCPSDAVLSAGAPMLVRNVESETGYLDLSWMAAPILSGAQAIGTILVQSNRREAFDRRDLSILSVLAAWTASMIELAQLRGSLEVGDEHALLGSGEAAARELSRRTSRLIATLAHELRTPLSFVQAGSEMLMTRLPDPEQLQQVAALVNQGSLRLAEVVDDIIESADLEAGPLELCSRPVDSASVVREAIAEVAGADQGRRVVVEGPEPLPVVRLDGWRLRSVVVRLLRNALKFSPESSTVTVCVSAGDGRLGVEISDTGFGIPASELEHIFEPFFRGEVSHARCIPGTGLGLSIVRQIVAAMGGEIRVRSQVDRGTTVELLVPFEEVEAGTPHAEGSPLTAGSVDNRFVP